jgi:hypothetical protein
MIAMNVGVDDVGQLVALFVDYPKVFVNVLTDRVDNSHHALGRTSYQVDEAASVGMHDLTEVGHTDTPSNNPNI